MLMLLFYFFASLEIQTHNLTNWTEINEKCTKISNLTDKTYIYLMEKFGLFQTANCKSHKYLPRA